MDLTYPIENLLKEVKKLSMKSDEIAKQDSCAQIYHSKKMIQVFEAISVLQKIHNSNE